MIPLPKCALFTRTGSQQQPHGTIFVGLPSLDDGEDIAQRSDETLQVIHSRERFVHSFLRKVLQLQKGEQISLLHHREHWLPVVLADIQWPDPRLRRRSNRIHRWTHRSPSFSKNV